MLSLKGFAAFSSIISVEIDEWIQIAKNFEFFENRAFSLQVPLNSSFKLNRSS